MTLVRHYMGTHPTVTGIEDVSRRVDPDTGAITDVASVPRGELRWLVAVTACPHCGGSHEHPVARVSGWGWYRAPCQPPSGELGYYLTVEAPDLTAPGIIESR